MDKDKEKLLAWLSKLAKSIKEMDQLHSFEGGDEVKICRYENIQFFHGIRKVIDALGLPYKESYTLDKERRRVSFVYDGVEFVELEDT